MDHRLRTVAFIIGIMIIVAGGLMALTYAWPGIRIVIRTASPFVVGLIFAYIFDPVVTFVQRRLRLSRIGGVLLLYFIFIAAITGFFAVVLPILVRQTRNAWEGSTQFLSEQVDTLSRRFAEPHPFESDLERSWFDWLKRDDAVTTTTLASTGTSNSGPDVDPPLRPPSDADEPSTTTLTQTGYGVGADGITADSRWRPIINGISRWLEEQGVNVGEAQWGTTARTAAQSGAAVVGDAVTFVISLLVSLFGTLAFLVFAVIVNIYLLLDFSKLRGLLEVMIPFRHQARTFEILAKVDVAVGGFIRGMLIDAFLVGLMTFVGLTLLGLGQYALLIGIIAGVGNLIPYLGTIVAISPAILYVMFSTNYDGTQERLIYVGLVIALFSLIQTIEGFILQPRIVGKSAQLHPMAVLFALAFGANFGLLGMIVAVPLACVVRVLVKEFYWDRRENKWRLRTGYKDLEDASEAYSKGKQGNPKKARAA